MNATLAATASRKSIPRRSTPTSSPSCALKATGARSQEHIKHLLRPGTIPVSDDRKYPQGGLSDARRPKGCQQGVWGLRRSDRLLVSEQEPPLGSHLVTPRRGFSHHGIYVGRGNVVHYKSAAHGFCRGPVEEVSLARFALGRAIWVRIHVTPRFDGAEVARRARSRVGEDRYRLLSNNCEHFSEWCLQDEQRSYQVERLLSLPRRLARVFRGAVTAVLPARSGLIA
jgi:hypothetical protein